MDEGQSDAIEDGADATVPNILELDPQQCEELLRRHSVGRLAFTLHDRVQIVPIHFVYDEGWVYGRTAGGKLGTLQRNKSVAFEVDESDGIFSWKSVVVHGPFYLIGRGADADEQVFERAVALLRQLIPDTLEDNDPVPFRNQLFRINAAEITGRAAVPSGGEIREPDTLPRSAVAGRPEADAKLLEEVLQAVATILGDSASSLDIGVSDGVVLLSGMLHEPASRRAVEDAVKALDGVLAVVQQIETGVPRRRQRTPAELGGNAARAMRHLGSPEGANLKVVVENGWLRLEGTAANANRQKALDALHEIPGIRGVIDRTDRE